MQRLGEARTATPYAGLASRDQMPIFGSNLYLRPNCMKAMAQMHRSIMIVFGGYLRR